MVVCLAVLAVACAVPAASQHTPVASPSLAMPTVTVASSPTVAQATPTRQLATNPDSYDSKFFQTPLANDILFAPSKDPDCLLPCWQGLRVGISNREDVETMFQEVFQVGLDGSVFAPIEVSYSKYYDSADVPGTQVGGHTWHSLPPQRTPHTDVAQAGSLLGVYVRVDRDTGLLRGIEIDQDAVGGYRVHTAQQIFEKLGQPSEIYARAGFGTTSDPDAKSFTELLLVYREGLAFFLSFGFLPKPAEGGGYFYEYCFDQEGYAADFIVNPLDLKNGPMDPVQKAWVGKFLTSRLNPVTAVFDLTEEEFFQRAFEEHPCVRLKPQE